jgi:hypothetical protein
MPAGWTPDEMGRIKDIMQQIKAAKADRIGENMDPGPIDVGAGYHDWVGRFRNKLRSTIGAADVPIIYVIRPSQSWIQHGNRIRLMPQKSTCMRCDLMDRNTDRIVKQFLHFCTIVVIMSAVQEIEKRWLGSSHILKRRMDEQPLLLSDHISRVKGQRQCARIKHLHNCAHFIGRTKRP